MITYNGTMENRFMVVAFVAIQNSDKPMLITERCETLKTARLELKALWEIFQVINSDIVPLDVCV